MNSTLAFLDTRASFELAALFVSWAAIVLLALVVANLQARLHHLERKNAAPKSAAYSHLIGTPLPEAVAAATAGRPRLLLFLSASCRACRRVMEELGSPSWNTPTTVVWSGDPPDSPSLASSVTMLGQGAEIKSGLGVRVMPFAVVVGDDGRIASASPINTLSSLADVASDSIHLPLAEAAV